MNGAMPMRLCTDLGCERCQKLYCVANSIVVDGLAIKGWSRIARLASMVDNLLTENQIGLCTNQAMNA
jgi:hypothetical protein